jgi:hypothetical protein
LVERGNPVVSRGLKKRKMKHLNIRHRGQCVRLAHFDPGSKINNVSQAECRQSAILVWLEARRGAAAEEMPGSHDKVASRRQASEISKISTS